MSQIRMNMGIIQTLLQKKNLEIGILEHVQYISLCLDKIRKIITTIEETVSLSFSGITNVQLFSREDVINIATHLRSIYPVKVILKADPYHLYENLKFTTTQVMILGHELIVILSVPITDGSDFQLYSVYPVPSDNNLILIPPERFYLQGSTPKWTGTSCIKGTQHFVCNLKNVQANPCNLTNTAGCNFASATNNIKLFALLTKEHLLFSSTTAEVILQTCPRYHTAIQLKGTNIISTNETCPISTMGATLEPRPTNYTHHFILPEFNEKPKIDHTIKFQLSHLNIDNLKTNLEPIKPLSDPIIIVSSLSFSVIIVLICIIIVLARTHLYALYLRCVKKTPPVAGDGNSGDRGRSHVGTTSHRQQGHISIDTANSPSLSPSAATRPGGA